MSADFGTRFGPWAVIAGGSDGIGAAFAQELAQRGIHLVLIARNEDKLAAKAAELTAGHGVETRTISLDLCASTAATEVSTRTADLDVGLCIYNAGAAGGARDFLEANPEDAAALVQRNCESPVRFAHAFGQRLRARGSGGLILMSSLASLAGSAGVAAYAATKAFDNILAEGLWHEFSAHGVDVLNVLAGATRTETELAHSDAFDDAMDPAEVARGALSALGEGPHFVPGAANRNAARGLWPVPRTGLINAMSAATARLYGRPTRQVDGSEFDAD